MYRLFNPKSRKSSRRQLLDAIQGDDPQKREEAIWLFRWLGPSSLRLLTLEAYHRAVHVDRCLRLLDAILKIGLPLDEGVAQNLHFLDCHRDQLILDKVAEVLRTLGPRVGRNPHSRAMGDPGHSASSAEEAVDDYLTRNRSETISAPTGSAIFDINCFL